MERSSNYDQKRCPNNKSHSVIKWGEKSNRQRWYCKVCKKTFTRKNRSVSTLNQKPLFKKWVIGKKTLKDLSKESKKSKRTLQNIFNHYLNKPPTIKPTSNPKSILMIDGTKFENDFCLILYYDIALDKPQGLRVSNNEMKEEITLDLKRIKAGGVNCIGAVSDGKKALISSLEAIYGDIPKQRCLVHVQRQTLAWLTQRPKTEAGKVLREICKYINKIKTKNESKKWIKAFLLWDKIYNDFLKEKTIAPDGKHWWYTHRNLRRVRRHLLNALPCMFLYLEYPKLPKDTNKLEGGIFSPLKDHCRTHRGITKERRTNFLVWHVYFRYFNKD